MASAMCKSEVSVEAMRKEKRRARRRAAKAVVEAHGALGAGTSHRAAQGHPWHLESGPYHYQF